MIKDKKENTNDRRMSAVHQEEEKQGRRNRSESQNLEILCRWTRAFGNLLENKGHDLITQGIFFN